MYVCMCVYVCIMANEWMDNWQKNKKWLEESIINIQWKAWLILHYSDFVYMNGMYFGNGARCVEQGDQPWTVSNRTANRTSVALALAAIR